MAHFRIKHCTSQTDITETELGGMCSGKMIQLSPAATLKTLTVHRNTYYYHSKLTHFQRIIVP